jgi:tetratricopeptide (TPR) repeat protein
LAASPHEFRGSFSGRERNVFFHNPSKSERFFELGYALGLDAIDDERSIVPIDFDQDGDLDIVASSLQRLKIFENKLSPRSFVRVKLEATKTQHHALGAEVLVTAEGVTQRDYVKLTAGFQSQVSLTLHFGLADAKIIEKIEVHWPSGAHSSFRKVKVDQLYKIVEGTDKIIGQALRPWPAESKARIEARLSLKTRAQTVDGETKPIRTRNQATVINFWAPWCAPCQEELPVLSELSKRFGKNIEFIGVSVEKRKHGDVKAAIKKHDLKYAQFYANDALVESFFGADGEIPLPSTFVFSSEGTLQRVFTRAVSRQDLEALLSDLDEDPLNFEFIRPITESYMIQGKHQEALDLLKRANQARPKDIRILSQLGNTLAIMGQNKQAIAQLKEAVRLEAKSHYSWYVMGVVLKKQGRMALALRSFKTAFRLSPKRLNYAMSLGAALSTNQEHESAVEIFIAASKIDPTHILAWVNLGKSYARIKKQAKAAEAFGRALKLKPNDHEIQALYRHFSARP